MLVVRFTVPGKPMPLQRARVQVRNGKPHHFTPKESVAYQEKVRRAAVYAGCPVFAAGCEVVLRVFMPDKRVRDLDNVCKGVADALQTSKRLNRRAIAWVNDHDIGKLTLERGVDRERPRLEVLIRGEVLISPGEGWEVIDSFQVTRPRR